MLRNREIDSGKGSRKRVGTGSKNDQDVACELSNPQAECSHYTSQTYTLCFLRERGWDMLVGETLGSSLELWVWGSPGATK